MYHQLKINQIGIKLFEKIVLEHGLTIKTQQKKTISTDGLYEKSDVNLINKLVVKNINQVIVENLTYML